MTNEELKKILEEHRDWLNNRGGKRADLRETNLRETNLREADLRGADLRGADLYGADLSWADLRKADLRKADLRETNLRGADLRQTNLYGANLLSFQFQKHQAYCTGERLIIGCKDHSLIEWATNYEKIGKNNNYTDLQIAMYKQFIDICIKYASTNGEK